MAKKVFLHDLNETKLLPITRGELVLDSSGEEAFHSSEFLANNSLPGLMSAADKIKLDILSNIPCVIGKDSDQKSKWTGESDAITKYVDGLSIIYVPKVAGTVSKLTLLINELPAKPITISENDYTSADIAAGSPLLLTYSADSDKWFTTDCNQAFDIPNHVWICEDINKTKIIARGTYAVSPNSYVPIIMPGANSQTSASMRFFGTGSTFYPIYLNGQPVSESNYGIPKGFYLVYFDGSYVHLNTNGILPGKIDKSVIAEKVQLNIVEGDGPGVDPDYETAETLCTSLTLTKGKQALTDTVDVVKADTIQASGDGSALDGTYSYANVPTTSYVLSNYKPKQTPVSATDYTTNEDSTTLFVSAITLNENGEIAVTKQSVKASDLGLTDVMRYIGKTSTQIAAHSTTKSVTIGEKLIPVEQGDVVINDGGVEFIWNGEYWEEFGREGTYKVLQSYKHSPNTSGAATEFIDTIVQDVNGDITATKKYIPKASYDTYGIIQVGDNLETDGNGVLSAIGYTYDNSSFIEGDLKEYYANTYSHIEGYHLDLASVLGTSLVLRKAPFEQFNIKFTDATAYVLQEMLELDENVLQNNLYIADGLESWSEVITQTPLFGAIIGILNFSGYGIITHVDTETTYLCVVFHLNTYDIDQNTEVSPVILTFNQIPDDYLGDTFTFSNTDSVAYGLSHAEGLNGAAFAVGHSEGIGTNSMMASHAEGSATTALNFSHSEGMNTHSDYISHAEGFKSSAIHISHAEGVLTQAYNMSHTEGIFTIAKGAASHSEGVNTESLALGAHAEGNSTKAEGSESHAEGSKTHASGWCSHAEGYGTIAASTSSHAEGSHTLALLSASHAEGDSSIAQGHASHAEGYSSHAEGESSHAEGHDTHAQGQASHAEGYKSTATGYYTHAEGYSTEAIGDYSHAEGHDTDASGASSHAEGKSTHAEGDHSHAEGLSSHSVGSWSHAEGVSTTSSGTASHAEGNKTVALGSSSHAEGASTVATGFYSHAEGLATRAVGEASHSEGYETLAYGKYSHAEGQGNIVDDQYVYIATSGSNTTYTITSGTDYKYLHVGMCLEYDGNYYAVKAVTKSESAVTVVLDKSCKANASQANPIEFKLVIGAAYGAYSHVEGKNNTATGVHSHAEGNTTRAFGESSHAEGRETNALLTGSHAEGNSTTSSGLASHAEGHHTKAENSYAHSEGSFTIASGSSSHTEGHRTQAKNSFEHAQGCYNKSNTSTDYKYQTISSIGIGKYTGSDSDPFDESKTSRKNAFEVMASGDAYLVGVGGYDGTNPTTATTLQTVINNLSGSSGTGGDIPVATSDALGGIKLGYTESGANLAVKLASEKAYVTLSKTAIVTALGFTPGTGSGSGEGTVTSITPGIGLTGANGDSAITSSGTINLKQASTTELGGIKTNYTANDKNYAVKLDNNGNAYVNVPWLNNTYTVNNGTLTLQIAGTQKATHSANTSSSATFNVPEASSGDYGVIKVSSKNASAVTVNSETTTAGRYYPVELNSDGKAIVNVPWSDTKNTAGSSNSASDLFIIGATSLGANPQTYSNSSVKISSNAVKASGGFYQESDERLKDFKDDILVDLEQLSKLPKKTFTWKHDDAKETHIGTSAQEVQKLYPELVKEDSDGTLSVAYDKLSIIALKAIDELYKRNIELEKRIKELENK